jgi:putative transposase
MPRNPRCVLPGVAHHITQRGVDRCNVFYSHADRATYLHLLHDHLVDAAVRVLGFCLMTNHVHWVVVPERDDSLAVLFRRVHGRYAQYLNARRGRTGHLWQNRFFSCAVGPDREDTALRYVEWNPVRAGIVDLPQDYKWSSAAAHLAGPGSEQVPLLDWNYWVERGGASAWKERIGQPEDTRDVQRVRRSTHAGSPLGSAEFVESLERQFGRQWRKQVRPATSDVRLGKGTDLSASISLF